MDVAFFPRDYWFLTHDGADNRINPENISSGSTWPMLAHWPDMESVPNHEMFDGSGPFSLLTL